MPRFAALIDVEATASPPGQLMSSGPCWSSPTRQCSLLSCSYFKFPVWL